MQVIHDGVRRSGPLRVRSGVAGCPAGNRRPDPFVTGTDAVVRGRPPRSLPRGTHHGTARSSLRPSLPPVLPGVRPAAVRGAAGADQPRGAAARRPGDRPLPLPAPDRSAGADRAGARGGLQPADGRPAAAGAGPARRRRPGRGAAAHRRPRDACPGRYPGGDAPARDAGTRAGWLRAGLWRWWLWRRLRRRLRTWLWTWLRGRRV